MYHTLQSSHCLYLVDSCKARHLFKTEIAWLPVHVDIKKKQFQKQTIFSCAMFLPRQFAEATCT